MSPAFAGEAGNMLDDLAFGISSLGFAFLVVTVVGIFVAIGYRVERQRGPATPAGAGQDGAFSSVQGAIFATMALLLGFTFTITSTHYDERRILLRNEGNAIGTAALRADYLPKHDVGTFRSLLLEYARTRIDCYESAIGTPEYNRAEQRNARLANDLWTLNARAGRADPHNVELSLLTQSLNESIDTAGAMEVALRTHIPISILGLMLLLMLGAAFATGLGFARDKAMDIPLTVAFLVLVSALVFTIDDLDRPQTGIVRIDVSPIRMAIDAMPGSR
jgi:FtsH-binding integral membrane protein